MFKGSAVTSDARNLLKSCIVWDNHACMPLRPGSTDFLPQLERHRCAGATVISVNVHTSQGPWYEAFLMLATFRSWIAQYPDKYRLINEVADIDVAKDLGQLGIVFDIEGGIAVEPDPGLVELYYRLGVRWLSLAYNKNNRLGGGCQDVDGGLTPFGRRIVDEMERVGMVLCCSHTGYETSREVMEYSRRPVIFSHSNARALCDHPRNVPDELIRQCAGTGGVVNINGFGVLLGEKEATTTERLLRHIDYVADLVGPEHVGLGLDYVFDQQEIDAQVRRRPDLFPPEKGYVVGMSMTEPERIPVIAEGLVKRGYSNTHIRGILGHNNLRIAKEVWKPI